MNGDRKTNQRTFEVHLSRDYGTVEIKRQIEATSSAEAAQIALRDWDQAFDAQVSIHVRVIR